MVDSQICEPAGTLALHALGNSNGGYVPCNTM